MSNTRGKLPNSPEILYLTIVSWCVIGIVAMLALAGIGYAYQIVRLIIGMFTG